MAAAYLFQNYNCIWFLKYLFPTDGDTVSYHRLLAKDFIACNTCRSNQPLRKIQGIAKINFDCFTIKKIKSSKNFPQNHATPELFFKSKNFPQNHATPELFFKNCSRDEIA